MSGAIRWYLLCEDRTHERFFTRLGERLFHSPPKLVERAPKGTGAASNWVLKRFPEMMRKYPRRYPNENVALVVAVDGDNEGSRKRRARFDNELVLREMEPKRSTERVALCVPTWSIETWLAALCGWTPKNGILDEARTFKVEVGDALRDGRIDLGAAVRNWTSLQLQGSLASLDDARAELACIRS